MPALINDAGSVIFSDIHEAGDIVYTVTLSAVSKWKVGKVELVNELKQKDNHWTLQYWLVPMDSTDWERHQGRLYGTIEEAIEAWRKLL